MWKDRIGLQVYSVREQLEADFYGTLKAVKEMGYTAVEFAGLYGNDPLEIRKMCDELGLIPLSAHVPYVDLINDTERTLEAYRQIGCQYVAVPYLTEEYRPGAEKFEEMIEGVKKIGAAAAEKGMVLLYHNHDFEFVKLDGKYALDILYEEVGPELLQTEIDTCWVNVGGENPSEYVAKYAGRIPLVHLKDYAGTKSEKMYALIGIEEEEDAAPAENTFEFRPVGKGVQDFPSIVKAAIDGGAQWFIVEQDMPSMGLTPLECAKASVEYVKSILE